MSTTGEKAPTSETVKALSADQRSRITKLAELSREENKPDFSKSNLLPSGFNGTIQPSTVAIEFFYRVGVITKDEKSRVGEVLQAKEAEFAGLPPEESAKYEPSLTGSEFDAQFYVVEDLVRDFHGNIFDDNLGRVRGFISFIILDNMKIIEPEVTEPDL
jgi:hypothetical protein